MAKSVNKKLDRNTITIESLRESDQKFKYIWDKLTRSQRSYISEYLFKVLGPGKYQVLDYSLGLNGGKPLDFYEISAKLQVPISNIIDVRIKIVRACREDPFFEAINHICDFEG